METQTAGDRRDGRLLRELDSLHFITGIIYPNRCDNGHTSPSAST